MTPSDRKSFFRPSRLVGGLIVVGLLLGGYWYIEHPLALVDFVVSRQFTPTTEVQQLSSRIKLTDNSNYLARASQSRLSGAEEFNQNCQKIETTMAILGCYTNRQIYVYKVANTDLDGVMETTMAHELLHAAYDRLTARERRQIDDWLQADYRRLRTAELDQRMKFYDQTEPGQANNELHSILATEFIELSPDLEKYYQRYFRDRKLVVGFYQQYSEKFASLEREAKQLSIEIENLEADVRSKQATYESQAGQLNLAITNFNRLANTGDFASQAAFYQERQRLVSWSENLEILRMNVNQIIDQYNQKITAYNNNVAKSQVLSASLDSLSPTPKLD